MKTFTTSAQRTVTIPKTQVLEKLEAGLNLEHALDFKATGNKNIKEAKLADGSKLVIAAFDKENGKTLAMIDHQNISAVYDREPLQQALREKLDELFPNNP